MENIQPNKIQYSDPLSVIIDKELRDLTFGKNPLKEFATLHHISVFMYESLIDYYQSIQETAKRLLNPSPEETKEPIKYFQGVQSLIVSYNNKLRDFEILDQLHGEKISEIMRLVNVSLLKEKSIFRLESQLDLVIHADEEMQDYSSTLTSVLSDTKKIMSALRAHVMDYRADLKIDKYLADKQKKQSAPQLVEAVKKKKAPSRGCYPVFENDIIRYGKDDETDFICKETYSNSEIYMEYPYRTSEYISLLTNYLEDSPKALTHLDSFEKKKPSFLNELIKKRKG